MDIRYTLIGNYLEGKLRPELVFRHVLKQNRISNEFGETQTPSFSLFDINLQYQFTKYANISAGINNVLDANYYEHLSRSVRGNNLPLFAAGQNAFASVNFVF